MNNSDTIIPFIHITNRLKNEKNARKKMTAFHNKVVYTIYL